MTERVLWEGKIRILEIEEGSEIIVRLDGDPIDLDGLVYALRLIKSKFGDNSAIAMLHGLIGVLERMKIHVMLLEEEVFR